MTQIVAPKVTSTVAVGSDSDESSSSKVVMTAVLIPSEAADDAYRAVHVQTRIIRRD
jgi:hypothetical protein